MKCRPFPIVGESKGETQQSEDLDCQSTLKKKKKKKARPSTQHLEWGVIGHWCCSLVHFMYLDVFFYYLGGNLSYGVVSCSCCCHRCYKLQCLKLCCISRSVKYPVAREFPQKKYDVIRMPFVIQIFIVLMNVLYYNFEVN